MNKSSKEREELVAIIEDKIEQYSDIGRLETITLANKIADRVLEQEKEDKQSGIDNEPAMGIGEKVEDKPRCVCGNPNCEMRTAHRLQAENYKIWEKCQEKKWVDLEALKLSDIHSREQVVDKLNEVIERVNELTREIGK